MKTTPNAPISPRWTVSCRAHIEEAELDLAVALLDVLDDLPRGRRIIITRDQGGHVHVEAPNDRIIEAIRACYRAEAAAPAEVAS
ncbi:hypothetical protein BH23CHL8_BH23CHL8_30830 [soil metagenome]